MRTATPADPGRSPAPGIIPEPARVQRDDAPAPTPSRGLLHRLLGRLRGDRYMVGAYPPDWHDPIVHKAGADTPPAPPASVPKER